MAEAVRERPKKNKGKKKNKRRDDISSVPQQLDETEQDTCQPPQLQDDIPKESDKTEDADSHLLSDVEIQPSSGSDLTFDPGISNVQSTEVQEIDSNVENVTNTDAMVDTPLVPESCKEPSVTSESVVKPETVTPDLDQSVDKSDSDVQNITNDVKKDVMLVVEEVQQDKSVGQTSTNQDLSEPPTPLCDQLDPGTDCQEENITNIVKEDTMLVIDSVDIVQQDTGAMQPSDVTVAEQNVPLDHGAVAQQPVEIQETERVYPSLPSVGSEPFPISSGDSLTRSATVDSEQFFSLPDENIPDDKLKDVSESENVSNLPDQDQESSELAEVSTDASGEIGQKEIVVDDTVVTAIEVNSVISENTIVTSDVDPKADFAHPLDNSTQEHEEAASGISESENPQTQATTVNMVNQDQIAFESLTEIVEDGFEFIPKTVSVGSPKTRQAQNKSDTDNDLLETIESFPKPTQTETKIPEKTTSIEPQSTSVSKHEESEMVKPKETLKKEAVVHRKLYTETQQVFKPMTIEQIQALYYNPQLAKNPQFIDNFILHEGKKDNHEFFEILLSYFRSRKNLISSEEDIKGLQASYVRLQDEMWITTTQSVSAQATCGDGSKVSTTHLYETCKLNEDALHSMQVTLQSIRDHIQEELTLHAYSSQLSKLQVESYIHNLFISSPALRDIPKNSPVCSLVSQRGDVSHQAQRLRDCLSVLFLFHRRPIKDVEFITNTRQWTDRLAAALLRVATFDDHLFLLNHVLRCPAGVGKWATRLIQISAPGSCDVRGSFGNPLLDHLVTALATVLFPTQSRDVFMSQMKTCLTADSMQNENTWILVDSDGEEDEDPSNAWLYLHENDIVSFLMQFPVTAVFAHILKATLNQSGTPHYDVRHSSESDVMRTFAFCTCWVNLLGSGLQTYCMARYRQLNKRLGKMIRQTVSYVSDHWLNFKASNTGRLAQATLDRLQMEFDQFFMRSTYCILTAQKLGSWQFMADMPFTCVSSGSMWQLLWVLHQGQSQPVNLDSLPARDFCEGYLKDPDSRQQLADNLLNLQTSETIYLLTTFANMAQCRPAEETDFIQTVSFGVFEISYTCSHTREFCSKVGRELLSSIVVRHPFILSLLLQRSKEIMPKLGMMSLYLFRELPMWSWMPSDPDMLVLRQWLLNSDLHQPENQLARLVLSRMNWSIDQEASSLVLPMRLHRQVSVLLVETYSTYISSRHMGAVIGEGIRQMASVVRQNHTQEQLFNNWTWDLLLKLKLHRHSIISPGRPTQHDIIPPDILKDDWLMPVVKGLKLKNPVACFVALALTNIGHNTTSFATEGMDHLLCLSSWNQITAVLHILSCVAPYFYNSPQYYMQSDGFLKIQQSLLAADESLFKMAKSVLGSQFPGTVTKQFSDMIQGEVSKHMLIGQETTVLVFWLRALMKVPRWSADRNCCYVIDDLIKRAFTVQGAFDHMRPVFVSAFKELRKTESNQGLVTSVVSWIASGVTLPSLMERNSFPEFTWLAYMILQVEAEYEEEIKLWMTIIQDMYADTKLTADQALRRGIPRLKLEQAPILTRLNIYRWAQQALDTPITHPLLPVVYQRFFILYLGRKVFDSSLPQRASVGERFFDSMSMSSMLKKMKKRLGEASDHHMSATQVNSGKEGDDAHAESAQSQSSKEHHSKLARLYQTYALWLDEPRLHDANLYLPSLPPQYESARLLQVFQHQMIPWLEYVDLDNVQQSLSASVTLWRKLVNTSSSDDIRSSQLNPEFDPATASKRILTRLRDYDPPLEPPSLVTLRSPVPDISTHILEEKHSLIHLLDADLHILKEHTRVFSTRVAQHCAVDGAYLDLLPALFTNDLKQVTLTIECKSKVNPLHRCSNPAVVNVQIKEKTQNQNIVRKIDENRAEYKQVMIECLLPPPSNVCISAVHVENAITMLIKLAQSSTDEGKTAILFDIASTLFFHMATMINEDTDFYLPTKQFFSSCLEILGQEFLSRDASQTQLLLQFCLDNPSLSSYICPHFVPNNTPDTYVAMYEQLIHVLQQRNMDLVFTLLTKFDVWTWLQTSLPPERERRRFVGILGSALMACGAEPEKKTKLVFDLYCSHLNSFLQTKFPENLSDVLGLIIQGSAVERLHVQCWEILLGECFTPVAPDLPSGQRKPSFCFSLTDVEACTDTLLATTQVTDLLQFMSAQFMQMRIRDAETATFGLYPKWNRYIPYVSQFLGGLMRSFVTKMLPNFSEMNPYQVLDLTWKQLVDLFAPWIQPLVNPQQIMDPWIESDTLIAHQMVSMFRKLIDFIKVQFSGRLPDLGSRVLAMTLMYYMNCLCTPSLPSHVSELFCQELKNLPWEELKPDLQLVEVMAQLKERVAPHCFHLIGYVMPRVAWHELVQYLMMYQPPEMTARFQASLLILLVQCYGNEELLQRSETVQLLTSSENFNWHFVGSGSYRVASNWFMQICDPKCVLAERSSALALGLRVMRVAAGFSADPGVAWSEDLSTKRLMYVHCVTQLLCQCSYKADVNTEAMGTVVVNLLTEIETVETSVSDVTTQQQESLDLVKDVLSLLNNCNPEGSSLLVVMATIREWLQASPHSILLTPCIKAANRCLASLQQMVQIMEACIEVYFTADQSSTSTSGEWGHILAVFQMPELNVSDCVSEAINQGSYLMLYSHVLQQLPLCQSLDDEFRLVIQLVDWTVRTKPGSENEGKLLLWWHKMLELILRQFDNNSPSRGHCVTELNKFLSHLIQLGEDRASSGLLGAIGFGKKSSLSLKFRVICRTLSAFLSTQMLNKSELRLQSQQPLCNTQTAKQARQALASLRNNKQYAQFKEQIDMVNHFVQDNTMCFRDSLALLQQLVQAFFVDLNYLRCIH